MLANLFAASLNTKRVDDDFAKAKGRALSVAEKMVSAAGAASSCRRSFSTKSTHARFSRLGGVAFAWFILMIAGFVATLAISLNAGRDVLGTGHFSRRFHDAARATARRGS